jgi:hypothetical protein
MHARLSHRAHLVVIVADVKVEVGEEVLVCMWLAIRPWLGLCLTDETPQWQVIIKEHLQVQKQYVAARVQQ